MMNDECAIYLQRFKLNLSFNVLYYPKQQILNYTFKTLATRSAAS